VIPTATERYLSIQPPGRDYHGCALPSRSGAARSLLYSPHSKRRTPNGGALSPRAPSTMSQRGEQSKCTHTHTQHAHIYLYIHPSGCLCIYLSNYLSIHVYIRRSIDLSIYISIYPIYLYIYLSISIYICIGLTHTKQAPLMSQRG